ncbi:MAG TPA: hypothetical protein DEF51_18020, partial [Myxococcales bacterium]|nr:hypothetical protein [Myxococcales bacterium]
MGEEGHLLPDDGGGMLCEELERFTPARDADGDAVPMTMPVASVCALFVAAFLVVGVLLAVVRVVVTTQGQEAHQTPDRSRHGVPVIRRSSTSASLTARSSASLRSATSSAARRASSSS